MSSPFCRIGFWVITASVLTVVLDGSLRISSAAFADEKPDSRRTQIERLVDTLFPPKPEKRGLQIVMAPVPEWLLYDELTNRRRLFPKSAARNHLGLTDSQLDALKTRVERRAIDESLKPEKIPIPLPDPEKLWTRPREKYGSLFANSFEEVLNEEQLRRYDAFLIQFRPHRPRVGGARA